MNDTRRTAAFIDAMMLAALATAAYAASISHKPNAYLALAILGLAAVTSKMKVKLPGINGNMSMNLPFLLTAVVNLSAAEAVLIACVSTAVQCWPRKNTKLNRQQMAFNLSMMTFAVALASVIFHISWLQTSRSATVLGLVLATATLFLGQTAPVACIVAISERRSATKLWQELAQLSFPYYVVSAGVTSMLQAMSSHLGWGLVLAAFPVMYGIHRSYRIYFGRLAETLHPPATLVRAAGAGV
jgi:hypothetical protein